MGRNKVDVEQVKRYMRGELSPREMYTLERQAQDDPMLMDMMLGMEQDEPKVHADNLDDIRRRLQRRTQPGHIRRRLSPAQRWAVAASVLLVATVGTVWFIRQDTYMTNDLALAPQTIDVPPAPATAIERDDTAVAPASESLTEAGDAAAANSKPRSAERLAVAMEPQPEAEEADETRVAPTTLARLAPGARHKPTDTLDEVVVVGFGTQAKSDLVGAVAKVDSKDEPARKLAGVQTTAEVLSGQQNGIRIRGTNRAMESAPPKGKLLDSETQQPLRNVALQFGKGQLVNTDSTGAFDIPTPMTNGFTPQLLGYELEGVTIPNKDTVVFAMKPNDMSLAEALVMGYGSSKAIKASKPEPATGWRAYNRYLKKAIKLMDVANGSVTLIFTVDAKGRPADIRVLSSTNENLAAEALRLVREGADWVPGKNGEREMEMTITF